MQEFHAYFINSYEIKYFQTKWNGVWEVFQNNPDIGEKKMRCRLTTWWLTDNYHMGHVVIAIMYV